MIIALDGSVCSGKTTIITKLQQKEKVFVVPEYMDILVEAQKRLFDKMSPEEKLEFLLQVDTNRNTLLLSSPSGQAILDRSVYCLFAFEYAKKAVDLHYTNSYLQYCINGNQYLFPDKIIYFETDEETRRLRCKKRGGSMPEFFLENEFNFHLKEFFMIMSRSIYINFIDTSHQDIDVVYEIVKKEIFGNLVIENQNGISALQAIFAQW